MKIVTILGTRPEIIRLSGVIEKLDQLCEHVLVHTGQNYDPQLKDVFFKQLGVRNPDYYLGANGSFGQQVATILMKSEQILLDEKPDRILVLGDTNSGLAAITAKRLGIKVFHMEAGNRCYDDRVPEELNRRLIDHSSDILMPYTERSRINLLRESIPGWRIYVTGNPIYQVIQRFSNEIANCPVLSELDLKEGGYFLVTLHRAENVDVEERLKSLTEALVQLQQTYDVPIIVSTHPHTRKQMEAFDIRLQNQAVQFLPPFGFFEFVALERSAQCVLTDSGTVQEECCIFKKPNVTLRDVTERPETLECGSNVLTGADPKMIVHAVNIALSSRCNWRPPIEYLEPDVASTVTKIVLGYHHTVD